MARKSIGTIPGIIDHLSQRTRYNNVNTFNGYPLSTRINGEPLWKDRSGNLQMVYRIYIQSIFRNESRVLNERGRACASEGKTRGAPASSGTLYIHEINYEIEAVWKSGKIKGRIRRPTAT